ncbi:MAG TPA: hypothetical protein VHF27_01680 [Acidimicrobiales bacterium]|nr:hypothetical protein [Acidimicrobiales bacterium]
MGTVNWLESIFSKDVQEGDVIKSRTLNVTKVTAILGSLATAVAGVVETQVDGPLDGLTPGQRLTLWISVLAFVGLVVITDMVVRGVTSSATQVAKALAPATPLPSGLRASYVRPTPNVTCFVVAARALNGQKGAEGGEFLITYESDGDWVADWVKGRELVLGGERRTAGMQGRAA